MRWFHFSRSIKNMTAIGLIICLSIVSLLVVSCYAVSETTSEGNYIMPVELATPTEGDISMSDVILIAKSEVIIRQGLTQEMLDGFFVKANLVKLENGKVAWVVALGGEVDAVDLVLNYFAFLISPSDAAVIDYQMDIDDMFGSIYTLWEERKGNFGIWSHEDRVLYNELYSEEQNYAIPGAGHIDQEEAARIALSAIPQTFTSPELYFSFLHTFRDRGTIREHIWGVTVFEHGVGTFDVWISAIDGEVIGVLILGMSCFVSFTQSA